MKNNFLLAATRNNFPPARPSAGPPVHIRGMLEAIPPPTIIEIPNVAKRKIMRIEKYRFFRASPPATGCRHTIKMEKEECTHRGCQKAVQAHFFIS